MLHYNFLCGCTNWGTEDYKFYFDQLARMRCNMLLMHWYDSEPGAAYEVDGEFLAGGRTPNSLSRPWGALASLRTSQFSFGAGRYFDAEIFSSPAGEELPDRITEIKETERMWAEATRYARTAGIYLAAGFEAPVADPTSRRVRECFRARLAQFIERNPHLSHLALWQHESGGCFGSAPPPAGTAAAKLLAKRRDLYAHLGAEWRIWEAIRYGAFAEIAAAFLAEEAPHLRLVVVGWGGDRWMRFADLCLSYDKILPPDVIFTCHDNIDASFAPNVSTAWGELPPGRERWAMPWVEGDIDDCLVRQPHVESLGKLAPDALRKGAQGLLTLQWRTRDVEEETGYIARFAWNPELTPAKFYSDLARHAFGSDHEADMGRVLGALQRLGARWTGVRGCGECSRMRWTGFVPHLPFNVTPAVIDYLVPLVRKAADALAVVPPEGAAGAAAGGAYHERSDSVAGTRVSDATRLGVRELEAVIARLEGLRGETREAKLRAGLRAIEEMGWELRLPLVRRGMDSPSYQALDLFLIAIHHLQRNAGADWHLPRLRKLRKSLARLREDCVRRKRTVRLERLDYLIATLDFSLYFDATAMLLADNEMVEQVLAGARSAREADNPALAVRSAAEGYTRLLGAGMQRAVEAFSRKLTTRCDLGTFATLHVKPLPLYWDAVERLEEFLPAVPPRELAARGWQREIWLSWDASPRAHGLNLYRRASGARVWRKVNETAPLAGTCTMFVDRPGRAGEYEYAVTALDAKGWESPLSHLARAESGTRVAGPEIVAMKPFGRVQEGEDLELRVIALSDRGIASVDLVWRPAGSEEWQRRPLLRRFRDSYVGALEASRHSAGLLEYYVEATDSDGNSACWPEAATRLPWTLVTLPDGRA
jgi:hypothetical protein